MEDNVDLFDRRAPKTKKLNEFIKRCRLAQLVSSATRVSRQKSSLLSVIMTNREEYYNQTRTVETGLSDHSLVFASRKRRKIPKVVGRLKCRNYRKLNESEFQAHFEHVDWSDILNTQDVNIAAELFHEIF